MWKNLWRQRQRQFDRFGFDSNPFQSCPQVPSFCNYTRPISQLQELHMMDSIILESLCSTLTEIQRETAEEKARQLAGELVLKGLQGAQDLKYVTKEHLLPHFNEFQALRLLEEWKKTTTASARGGPSTHRESEVSTRVSIPWDLIWELDSMAKKDPGELKQALEVEKRRPSNDAELLLINTLIKKVKRDHPAAKRGFMDNYVEHIATIYPKSFVDQCGSSELGYARFLKHTKDQFDNHGPKRKRSSGKEYVVSDMPVKAVLGLSEDQWHNTSLPEHENEHTQLSKKEKLKEMARLLRKNKTKNDIEKIKQLCQETYPSQRKDIISMHKAIRKYQNSKKRKSSRENEEEQVPEVSDLLTEWPFLFRYEMLLHMNSLYNLDIENIFSLYKEVNLPQMLEFLVLSQGLEGKVLEHEMKTAKEASTVDEPELLALIILLAVQFKEKTESLFFLAEDTIQMKDVRELPIPATPCIIACGSRLFKSIKFYLAMDKYCFFATKSFREAFFMIYSSYFIFHLDFPKSLGLVMEFIQREILDINPPKGTKRAEGNSCSPVSTKILDLKRDCSAYQIAIRQHDQNEKDGPLDLSNGHINSSQGSNNSNFSRTSASG